MSKLVDELKLDHKVISRILSDIKQIGILPLERMELLNRSKDKLLNHLSKEDTLLYPALIEQAKHDPTFKQTLDTFGREMDQITQVVTEFYSKYSDHQNVVKPSFTVDLSKLITALKNRIMKEEVAIYKAYEKLAVD